MLNNPKIQESTVQISDIKAQLWLMVKRQGISFIIILGVTYFFYRENVQMRVEIKNANDEIKTYYKTDNAEMRRVIERSNDVMERNNRIFEAYLKLKEK
jgi:hypothetical protein